MTIHFMAPFYWRSVQAQARAFSAVPPAAQDSVRALAQQDVEAGRITKDQYQDLIGTPFDSGPAT